MSRGLRHVHLNPKSTSSGLTPISPSHEKPVSGRLRSSLPKSEALEVLAILMASTIYVRYMGQKGSLISVMRRDVGFYFSVLVGEECLPGRVSID
jgi:hypothetical protein